ncbi:MAG: hypothetical protein LQ351_006191 [Letrouitia transgressa]|nr:MAG: hypothetical protein LQ351_006191 [Letrouitia transgressa]
MPTQLVPTEILQLIFSCCETTTLKNARLASRRFSELAAEELFRKVYFTFLPDYLESLADIGESKSLGKLVQTIFILHKPLNELYLDFEDWRSAIDVRPPFELFCKAMPNVPTEPLSKWPFRLRLALNRAYMEMPRDDLPDKVLKRCHSRFLYHCRGKRRIMSDPNTSIRLGNIFASFPRLSTIEEYRLGWNDDAPVYRSLLGNLNSPYPFITKMHKDTLLPDPFFQPYARPRNSHEQWSIHMMCTSLDLARAKLRDLEINIFSKTRTRRIYSEPVLFTFPHSTKGLVHLRNMNLSVTLPAAGTFGRSSEYSQFREFLQASPHLEALHLTIYVQSPGTMWYGDISPLLRRLKMPSLRELDIAFGRTRGPEFSEFLKRHTSTLRILSLKYLNTQDDKKAGFESAWEPVIKDFTPHMSLTQCSIKLLTEDQPLGQGSTDDLVPRKQRAYWHAVSAYILSRGTMEYPKFNEPLMLEIETPPLFQEAETCFDNSTGLWSNEEPLHYREHERMRMSETEPEDHPGTNFDSQTDNDWLDTDDSWDTDDSLRTEDLANTDEAWETEDSSDRSDESAAEID